MQYLQLLPGDSLARYIDAYWTLTGKNSSIFTEKILPDGCVDIILNLGDDFFTDNSNFLMKHNQAYLVGTMTRYKEIVRSGDTNLIGIRFKPGAFSFFYDFDSLHEIADRTIEFDKKSIPEINDNTSDIDILLNRFFDNKLAISVQRQSFGEIIADVERQKGQVTVAALARKYFTTTRQLERYFKMYVGISPKEYINFIRFQYAVNNIRDNCAKTSLLNIAFESGYYDHAHLSNEIKKYTGSTPSEL
jgi:AraC-like DNA-binding protein